MIAESVKAEKDAVIKVLQAGKVIEDMNIVENLHRIIKGRRVPSSDISRDV